MTEPISPYELLRMSKPKAAPTVVTAYDLYSAAQTQNASAAQQPPASRPANEMQDEPKDAPQDAPSQNAFPTRASAVSARRTHYIADIKSRHDMASRRSFIRPV